MPLCYMTHEQHGAMPVSTLKEVDEMKKSGWERVETKDFIKKMNERRKKIMAEAAKNRSKEEKAQEANQQQQIKEAEAKAREETQSVFVDKLKESYGKLKVNDLRMMADAYGIELEAGAGKDDIIVQLVSYSIENDTGD